MGGDYTRFSFEAEKAYNALLRQQGRVGLDADHNEAAEIADRRRRSGTYDLVGRCRAAATTPDAFHLTVTGPGTLEIGPGRAYVDGIQVECFGTGAPAWDPLLAELRRPDATPYDDQPFLSAVEPHLPDPPALGAPADGEQHLVYLDVWYREIDALIDPELREVALGGPDTATRLQTVWQVRSLALGDGDLECGDEVPAWTDLTTPSAGRLTTGTEAPQPHDNPCILSPEGGYRGRENRLYRVEVHAAGADGSAELKWSRDNASVRAAVTAMDTVQFDVDLGPGVNLQPVTRLTLSSLGRDAVLRFRRGDWLEVLDELADLDPARAGDMARVLDVDEANRTLTLDRDLVGPFDPTDENRRTRAVRWDQGDAADPVSGLLAVPAAPAAFQVDLEDGIHVLLDLDPAGGRFHVGDHWMFAARVATGSVEELVQAPPRGIHHHYCKLAIVTWPDLVESCIDPEPEEEGCCTEVVHPGESIQEAIDALPDAGGCVCLKAGEHPIDQPLVIARPNVHLHGESPGARVVRTDGVRMLEIGAVAGGATVADVVVETVELLADLDDAAAAGDAVVWIENAARVTLRSCRIEVRRRVAVGDSGAGATAVEVTAGSQVTVEACAVAGVWAGVTASSGDRLTVTGCELLAERLRAIGDVPLGEIGVVTGCAERNLVRDNRFDGFLRAVVVGPPAIDSLVEANRVIRPLASFGGGEGGAKAFAVELLAAGSVARDNVIDVPNGNLGGIRLAAQATAAESNWIEAPRALGEQDLLGIGVLVEEWFGTDRVAGGFGFLFLDFGLVTITGSAGHAGSLAGDGVVVADNRIYGPLDAVVVRATQGTVVRGNHLDTFGTALGQDTAFGGGSGTGVRLDGAVETRVAANRIERFSIGVHATDGRDNRVDDNQIIGGLVGVAAGDEQSLRVAGNAIVEAQFLGCALAATALTTEIADNRLSRCGWGGAGAFGGSILVLFSSGEVAVERCQVLDTAVPPAGGDRTTGSASAILLLAVLSCRVESNLVGFRELAEQDPEREDRALVAVGLFSFLVGDVDRLAVGSALVLGNKFLGPGRSALVQVTPLPVTDAVDLRFEKIGFSNNHCVHLTTTQGRRFGATVVLEANQTIVMGNHVKGTADGVTANDFPSFRLGGGDRVLLGNITTGPWSGTGGAKPPALGDFNFINI